MKKKYIIFIALISYLSACKPDEQASPEVDDDLNLGGETSISGSFINILQQPAANLSAAELDLHREADKAFGDIFVTAPNVINGGLGPIFNKNSCESCHVSNGRSPFPDDASDLRGLLIRISLEGFGAHGEPLAVPNFGGQLQTKAVFGKLAEARLSWQEMVDIKTFLDGGQITLTKPVFILSDPYMPLPEMVLTSPRIAPTITGLGLLEAVKEEDIMRLADPADLDQDGISGKVNRVWDFIHQTVSIGRFGWKAGQPTLLQQSAGAYNQDMGITNPYFPKESSEGQSQSDTLKDDPEIDWATLKAATFYTQSLAVPQRRNINDPAVVQGKNLFSQIKCSSCHHQKFITGQHPEFAFLSNQTIFPYSDLLLHDMGEALADKRPEFEADGREWRTAPLWAIGLTKTVGGQQANFLHDGRAKTLEEAIMWHGGEAENSKEAFRKLDKTERAALIKFLENL